MAFNLSVVIGPANGGFNIRSCLFLFLSDAVISLLTVFLIAIFLRETKPQAHPDARKKQWLDLCRLWTGLPHTAFMLFLGAVLLQVFTYMNMNTSLGVYLRNEHGTPESGYGLLLSMNAAMVVPMQFPITRRITKYPPMLMMAFGTFLYVIGFSLYGYVATYPMFVVAMVIITIGEMIVSPVSQALVASFAPEDMRGRYMAVSGFSWDPVCGKHLAG